MKLIKLVKRNHQRIYFNAIVYYEKLENLLDDEEQNY